MRWLWMILCRCARTNLLSCLGFFFSFYIFSVLSMLMRIRSRPYGLLCSVLFSSSSIAIIRWQQQQANYYWICTPSMVFIFRTQLSANYAYTSAYGHRENTYLNYLWNRWRIFITAIFINKREIGIYNICFVICICLIIVH